MLHKNQRPKQTTLTLALTAALASMTPLVAKADCVPGGTISSNTSAITWSSGSLPNNCSITSAGSISALGTNTALRVNSSVGTLTNSGTIQGGDDGLTNSSTIVSINNQSNATIMGAFATGILNINSSTIGALTNSGTISGASAGAGIVNNSSASNIGTLTNHGVITGGDTGIFNAGTIGTLTNNGNIAGGGGFGYQNFFAAIFNSGTIGILNNTIGGTIDGINPNLLDPNTNTNNLSNTGIINSAGGTIGTLNNSGLISNNPFWNTNTSGGDIGINNAGTIGTLNNLGTITATAVNQGATAILNSGTIGTLTNSGTISGTSAGIFNTIAGSIGTLSNSGTISGTNFGLDNSGSIGFLNNTIGGTISGANTGIFNNGSIGTLSNSGTISAPDAINNGAGGRIGTLTNSGVIAGNITNGSGNNLTITGGTGATFGTLTGFLSGSIGTITNTNSNLTFGSGNLLLNDTVNVGNNTFNNNAATLQVNNPIAITGNYNQGEAATLQIGVAGSGVSANGSLANDSGYGRLVVSGSATIASGSSVNLKPLTTYGFAAGQRFVVVDASTAGTNYNEGSLNYSVTSYAGSASGTDVTTAGRSDLVVTLTATPSPTPTPSPSPSPSPTPTPTPSPATIPNAISALGGLLNYTGVSPGLLNLFDAADALAATGGTAAVNRAGVQLAPVQQAASTGAAAAPTLDVLNVVAAHADSLRLAQMEDRQSGISTGDAPPAWGVWGQAFGGHASQNERDDVPGYSANYGGLLVGVDKSISDNWRAGGVFSYSNTAINDEGDAAGDNTTVNSYGLIGYASYTSQSWYTNLSAGVVQQSYSTNRQVDFTGFSGTANGHFSGQQYVTRAEVGYPLTVGGATVTPLASLTYSNLHQNGYTEGGGNGAALTVNSTHSASVKSSLGAKLEQAFPTAYGNFVPELRLQWLHEYDHTQQVTGASFAADPTGETGFTTVGPSPTSDMADVSVGVTLLRANNMTLTVRYELQAGGGFVSQTGSLRLRQLF